MEFYKLVKYLRVKIDCKLNRKSDLNVTITKLNWSNAMVYKVRDFVYANILKSINYSSGHKTLVQITVSKSERTCNDQF